jgi:hypothetical protein
MLFVAVLLVSLWGEGVVVGKSFECYTVLFLNGKAAHSGAPNQWDIRTLCRDYIDGLPCPQPDKLRISHEGA